MPGVCLTTSLKCRPQDRWTDGLGEYVHQTGWIKIQCRNSSSHECRTGTATVPPGSAQVGRARAARAQARQESTHARARSGHGRAARTSDKASQMSNHHRLSRCVHAAPMAVGVGVDVGVDMGGGASGGPAMAQDDRDRNGRRGLARLDRDKAHENARAFPEQTRTTQSARNGRRAEE
jgi:hypothetical protein